MAPSRYWVQGSRPRPYEVRIAVKALSKKDWEKVVEVVSGQPLFAPKLLAKMPAEIEQAFRDAKVSLFPERLGDLKTDCSCPDWSNPCKHIAAVYYLLGEEFDRDPFLDFPDARHDPRGLPRSVGTIDSRRRAGRAAGTAARCRRRLLEAGAAAAALRGPGPCPPSTRRCRAGSERFRFRVATPTWCRKLSDDRDPVFAARVVPARGACELLFSTVTW